MYNVYPHFFSTERQVTKIIPLPLVLNNLEKEIILICMQILKIKHSSFPVQSTNGEM